MVMTGDSILLRVKALITEARFERQCDDIGVSKFPQSTVSGHRKNAECEEDHADGYVTC